VKVQVFRTRAALVRSAAKRLAGVLTERKRPVLFLPAGKTAIPVYRELSRLHAAGRAPLALATTFNLDELRVPAGDPRSFRSFMDRHLFSKVDLPEKQIRFLRGDAEDPAAECDRYERRLAREGPPDIAFVGIGANGHVAYLEPAQALPPRTALVPLSAATRRGLARDGVRPVPREALTVGLETILASAAILLVASGSKKAPAVAAALEGPVTPQCPASFLSLHPDLSVMLDRAAAARLRSR
jgi:glucosamine-6-phosphate deaminase